MATAPARLWTINDLDALPANRYEIWEGDLVEMPGAGRRHTAIVARIMSRMQRFVEQHRLGDISGPDGGYVSHRSPDTLVVPDVAYIHPQRLPDDVVGYVIAVPDLVVEVVSPSDRMSDVRRKVGLYLSAGVSLIWVVLPDERLVQVYRRDQAGVVQEVFAGQELDGGDVLPGFRLPLTDIFD